MQIKIRSKMSGIGRHKESVIGDIGKDDIRAISKYLGDKKFMFGDKINTVRLTFQKLLLCIHCQETEPVDC